LSHFIKIARPSQSQGFLNPEIFFYIRRISSPGFEAHGSHLTIQYLQSDNPGIFFAWLAGVAS